MSVVTPIPSILGRAFPIVIVGHVDHGKSTLVGRLLHETNSLPDGKVEQLRGVSERRGLDFEWSFLLDALQVERDQGITVDTTQIWFHTATRRYVIIDAPGHKEFVKNMVTGAAAADAAILVVDAVAGLSEQTRRHAYILSLLGLTQVAVAVNKIDLVGFSEMRFQAVVKEVGAYLADLGITAATFIPISARHGDNIAARSSRTPWYAGPGVVAALDGFAPRLSSADQPLRFPLQDVYRDGERRILVGRIESGRLKVGDTLLFHPGGRRARVASIEAWSQGRAATRTAAKAGESIGITLDEEVFVERGTLASGLEAAPTAGTLIEARLFWLASTPLHPGQRLTLRHTTATHEVTLEAIDRVVDIDQGAFQTQTMVERNGIAEVRLRSRRPLALDTFLGNPQTGRGTLMQGHSVMGGIIIDRVSGSAAANLTAVAPSVTVEERAHAQGHRGGVLWLTGHSGAGKSTLAMGALRRLFDRGLRAVVLDGDNLRSGLNRDLGFSDADRTENIRRTAEVAKLMAETGQIVLVALISPRSADRAMAASIVGEGFREVFIQADVETCRSRDPKGLYARAARGEIPAFTGVSAPYEAPRDAALVLDTTAADIETSVGGLAAFAVRSFCSGDIPVP